MKFKKNIGGYFYLSLSIILTIFVIYKHLIVWSGDKFDFYVQYYFLSVICIAYSFIYFFLKQNIRNYLNLSLIGIILGLYFFEIYLNKISKNNIFNQLNQMIKIYESEKENSVALVVSPKSIQKKNKSNFLPLSGASNLRTLLCDENGYLAEYLSDRYGFNNPDFVWNEKSIDYLILGDSFAHGACVNRPFDVASVIRKKYDNKAINLGFAGNGPISSYAAYKEYGLKRFVRNIVLLYYEGNDLLNLKTELENLTLKKYFYDENFTQNLIYKQKKIDDLNLISYELTKDYLSRQKKQRLENSIKLTNTRKIIQFRQINYKDYFYKNDKDLKFTELEKIIKMFNDNAILNSSNFIFAYLPSSKSFDDEKFDLSNYKKIIKILEKNNISYIDFRDIFLDYEPLEFFAKIGNNFGHYNKRGYELVAKKIISDKNK